MRTRYITAFLGALLGLFTAVHAEPKFSDPADKIITDALAFRTAVAESVQSGVSTPRQALDQLKANVSPTGFKLDRDTELAFGAIDVGRRLAVAGKNAEAEVFFLAAEDALGRAIDKLGNSTVREKAMLLQQRAMLRGKLLNRPAESKSDIDAAQQLLPDDEYLKRKHDTLTKDKAEQFKEKKAPTKG